MARPKKVVKYRRSQVLWEAKNYGKQYVQNKYGMAVYNTMRKEITTNKADGRGTAADSSNGKKVKVRIGDGFAMRLIGDSSKNAPPVARDGNWLKPGRRVGYRDGGPSDPGAVEANGFQKKFKLNLDNEDELAQGSQHPWAQTTSISSLITGQLRQAQNNASDYWDQWAQDKGGQTALQGRSSSSFGTDVTYNPIGAGEQMATSQPMGAFGTSTVMQQYTEDGAEVTPTDTNRYPGESGVYNPWAYGEGGANNQFGPNPQSIANATMEAMQLANAYFAPQRMELAYELGDMETDMRRLAVNLGRQVDDPILQAKLYKEGMRAVRTMDVQQNTLAFQMGEARRKEEIQNYQFYDQLAQQEYQTFIANQQFMKSLDLQSAAFDLQRSQVIATQPVAPTVTSGPTPTTPAASEDRNYGNVNNYNPYRR